MTIRRTVLTALLAVVVLLLGGAVLAGSATAAGRDATRTNAVAEAGCTTDGTNTTLPSSILVYRVSLGRVDRVNFRTYVKDVLPNEWLAGWPPAALKAGAMAVKSFGWYWALHSTQHTPGGACFDVYDTTKSQVYVPGSAAASTNDAVDATWGVRMTRNGNILQAHYCATTTACSGWVNGDWMSQYGSRDLASAGKGYPSILKTYYDNVVLT